MFIVSDGEPRRLRDVRRRVKASGDAIYRRTRECLCGLIALFGVDDGGVQRYNVKSMNGARDGASPPPTSPTSTSPSLFSSCNSSTSPQIRPNSPHRPQRPPCNKLQQPKPPRCPQLTPTRPAPSAALASLAEERPALLAAR